jgi:hypothetical protein
MALCRVCPFPPRPPPPKGVCTLAAASNLSAVFVCGFCVQAVSAPGVVGAWSLTRGEARLRVSLSIDAYDLVLHTKAVSIGVMAPSHGGTQAVSKVAQVTYAGQSYLSHSRASRLVTMMSWEPPGARLWRCGLINPDPPPPEMTPHGP